MKNVSDEYKKIARKIKTQSAILTCNNTEIPFDSIVYSFEGNLFTTIMRELQIELESASLIKDQDVNFQYGLYVNNSFEYIDTGNFYCKDLEDDKKEEKVTVTAYDKMLNFMVDYSLEDLKATGLTFPCTMLEFVKAICTVCGNIELYTEDFYNADLEIVDDYFNNQGVTYRDVLEKIAEATLTTIWIKEDKLYLYKVETETPVDTLTTDILSNLVVSDKFGAVNAFVLGRGSVEDNIEANDEESIEANGRCEIRFDDNEFLDDIREDVIDNMFEQIKGLTYYATETSNIGVMWLEPCDYIPYHLCHIHKYNHRVPTT